MTNHGPLAELTPHPWAEPGDGIAERLDVDVERGLDPAEAERRLRRFGPNRLREHARRSPWEILADQFRSVVVALLAGAAVLSLFFGGVVESLAICVVLLLNAGIGFFTELRAVGSMEALRELGTVEATVRRGGEARRVKAEHLVPGDVVLVEGGDVVTADLRLVESSRLQANESALTGESVPVEKSVEPVPEDTTLAERASMLYKGTSMTRGSGVGVVAATGMDTELGHISSLVEEAEEEITPLEERLAELGRRLVWVTLAIAALVAVSGIAVGKETWLIVETAIALAVAAIPEGLPIVATLALARGMLRMARRNALVERLSAVETLGSTTVILTDKTGTLTENRMTVTRVEVGSGRLDLEPEAKEAAEEGRETEQKQEEEKKREFDDPSLRRLLLAGVLCNNATRSDGAHGDPMEVALLAAGERTGLRREALLSRYPEEREEAFDPSTRLMATFHRLPGGDGSPPVPPDSDLGAGSPHGAGGDGSPTGTGDADLHAGISGHGPFLVAVKGAPEAVLEECATVAASRGARDGATDHATGDGATGDAGEIAANGVVPLSDAERRRWLERNEAMADDGLRVLGLAARRAEAVDEDPYAGLTLLGLVGLVDPPRTDVRPSIEACHRAGIRVVVVTGDQAATAGHVARAVGIRSSTEPGSEAAPLEVLQGSEIRAPEELDEAARDRLLRAAVFARTEPAQKLDLLALHQEAGEVTAMIGDGVNDAPALKKADIGVAMGQRGTQVAREASDMVLRDDRFGSIVTAVEQGRVIFDNIRKFVVYLLSCNVSEILAVGIATVVNAPLPILPLQILFLNLVTDVFPALALGVSEGDPTVMRRPPRDPDEPVLTRRHWWTVAGFGLAITATVLGALALALGPLAMEVPRAVTVSFLTLAFAQLWHVFNMAEPDSGTLVNEVSRSPWVWAAVALCVVLLVLAVQVPLLAEVLQVVDPGATGWALAAGLAVIPLVLGRTGVALVRLAGGRFLRMAGGGKATRRSRGAESGRELHESG